MFREEATSVLDGSCGSFIMVKLEFGLLVFVEGGKPENCWKTLGARQEPTATVMVEGTVT